MGGTAVRGDDETVTFEDLVDTEVDLWGVDSNAFRVSEPGSQHTVTLEAMEDASDGYRSCLDRLRKVPPEEAGKLIFFGQPIARVTGRLSTSAHCDTLEFVDAKGHVWLELGTENVEDFYPCFVFRYSPAQVGEPAFDPLIEDNPSRNCQVCGDADPECRWAAELRCTEVEPAPPPEAEPEEYDRAYAAEASRARLSTMTAAALVMLAPKADA